MTEYKINRSQVESCYLKLGDIILGLYDDHIAGYDRTQTYTDILLRTGVNGGVFTNKLPKLKSKVDGRVLLDIVPYTNTIEKTIDIANWIGSLDTTEKNIVLSIMQKYKSKTNNKIKWII